MANDEFGVPAGWYPDPLGLPQLRWWNNHGWTEQVSAAPEPISEYQPSAPDAPSAAVVPVAPAAPSAPAAPKEQPALEAPPAPEPEPELEPVLAPAYSKYQAPAASSVYVDPSRYTKYAVPGWNNPGS